MITMVFRMIAIVRSMADSETNRIRIALLILSALALAGCWPEDRVVEAKAADQCFDIFEAPQVPVSKILLNKCTGETWVISIQNYPLEKGETVPGRSYQWHPMSRFISENSYSGR